MKSILILFSLIILNWLWALADHEQNYQSFVHGSQSSTLNSTLWEVKQDGTGDFTSISPAIDAAVDGDTILVYPGRYYENIDYNGKDIVLTSLYRVRSDDRRYIRETIIDGWRNGTVVTFKSNETRDAVLSGFTITNGEDYDAGGIEFQTRSSATIRYNIIEHNHAIIGTGGVQVIGGIPILIGNIIRYNTGGMYGGVVLSGGRENEFCTEEPNSIYFNYGAFAADIHIGVRYSYSSIVIDTLTVQNPDRFIFRYRTNSLPDDFNITVNHGKIDPIESDLYVSPDGCDSNSGLSAEEPLQRISTALTRIQPGNDYQQRSIYLAEGIYSRSLNDQSFPVGMRNYVDIVGACKETTILDGEDRYILIGGDNFENLPSGGCTNFSVKNLTLTNANRGGYSFGAAMFTGVDNFTLENLIITNNIMDTHHSGHTIMHFQECDNFTLRNLDINNNRLDPRTEGFASMRLFSAHKMWSGYTMYAENIRFRNNYSTHFGQIVISGISRGEHPHHATFANLEITDTVVDSRYPSGNHLRLDGKIRLINATLANSLLDNPEPLFVEIYNYNNPRTEVSIYNSIFYDNGDYPIIFARSPNHPSPYPDELNISYSLLEGGIDSIGGPGIVNWGEGNIDKNPLFIGENDQGLPPYSLSEDSPARGAGTLDIPDFEFPEYDIAGNPRIVDGKIDMGAYQYYKPTTSIEDEEREGVTERLRDGEFNLRNFPNPVTYLHSDRQAGQTRSSTGTTISFEAPESGEVVIEIYNVKGQFVRRVFDAYITKGEYNVFWDGKDERGRYVATGFYMYNLHFNDELVATGRATFIK